MLFEKQTEVINKNKKGENKFSPQWIANVD